MEAHDLPEVERQRRGSGLPYREFLRTRTMSVGLYALEAGAEDLQRPHVEDEVYHVVSGRARIRVGDEEREVGPGSVVFVDAGVDHRFVDIREALYVLVVFSPPEGSG